MFRNLCIALAVALALVQFATQQPSEALVRTIILWTAILMLFGCVRGAQRIYRNFSK